MEEDHELNDAEEFVLDDDDEGGDMAAAMLVESTLEEGVEIMGGEEDDEEEEGDYEGQMVEVEPEIVFNNEEYEDEEDGSNAMGFGAEHFMEASFATDDDASRSSGGGGTRRKTNLGSNCPICDQVLHKQHARDHVCWHFMDELKELIVQPGCCPDPGCEYMGEKPENVARHLALFHSKLDEFLQDQDLVDSKRIIAASKPKRISIGPSCIICGIKDPAREHVSRHFMKELMEIVAVLPDQLNCPDCNYHGEKPQNLARHIALVHSKLDELLSDEALIQERRNEFLSKPNKVNIGPNCPVCDQVLSKQHSRVHVIWHFMEELRQMVATFSNPNNCDLCEDYVNQSPDKVAKHIALGHSKLDELLQDEQLLQQKRAQAKMKPKKESIGPSCPICNARDPPREHVARHFGEELSQFVSTLPDNLACQECPYRGEKTKNLELHIALVHGKLDAFLKDTKLVQAKRRKFLSQPKKTSIGPSCPICDMTFTKSQNRDHVSWHFMDELREFVNSFDNPQACAYCNYTSEKVDNLVKHIALGHSKLDELLKNTELVAAKRAKALSKPKKIAVGPFCPICDVKEPTREHVARHFGEELSVYINEFEDTCACNECEYRGDKPKTLAIHVALVHGKLDLILANQDLVTLKRAKFMAKPKKQAIGPTCPVCDLQFTKNQNRDHVSWHYMEELRAIVNEFPDPCKCTQCPYTSDSVEKMVKHVALGHSMLDGFLSDQDLLQAKRLKALSKPKKVAVGPKCPVCDNKDPPREHVARHFSDELLDIVHEFPDETQCTECPYKNERPKNVAIHIALVHNILDQILTNEELVASKREKHFSRPQKVNLGASCPVCDMAFTKGQNRDHVCWHFMDELREIVMAFPDKEACNECSYRSDKLENLVKHVALGHSKLDELLQDDALVAQKRAIQQNKPKKINIGKSCPVCDMKFSKGQNRDHVSWHFMEELREFVRATGQEKSCTLCYYTTDKLDNLVKHYALGHSKLDELLQDDELVKAKREVAQKKPKRMSFGKDCPICGQRGRDRDHIARHFMPELMEFVHALPNKSKCDQCEYSNTRNEYMAKHIALFHCKLDEMMQDKELVQSKMDKIKSTPKKVAMGEKCIICNVGTPSREHVARHFIPELSKFVTDASPSPLSCPECHFSADKPEYVARHMGLVHCKLDELLRDSERVAQKSAEYANMMANSASASAAAGEDPLPMKQLPMRESVRKSQRQRELEERMAQEERAKKEREEMRKQEEKMRRDAERERKRMREEEKRKAAAELKAMQPPAKAMKMEKTSPNKPGSLLEAKLTSPLKQESLLMQTLLKSSPSPVANSRKRQPDETWNVSSPQEDGKLQIKIKRTTPAKWQIKEPPKGEEEEEEMADNEEMECEPDISLMMMPEISHNMDDEEEEEEQEGEYVDPTEMLLEPQIILDDTTYEDDEVQPDLFGLGELTPEKKAGLAAYSECPICDFSQPDREHITRHFAEELQEVVEGMEDPNACTQCEFVGQTLECVAIHIGIVHAQLERCLGDVSLVNNKRNEVFAASLETPGGSGRMAALKRQHNLNDPTTSIISLGKRGSPHRPLVQNNLPGSPASVTCPICDQVLNKSHSRDHIVWHFMDELRSMITGPETQCPACSYKGEKSENVARHLALFHGQLDSFLQNEELVLDKRARAMAKPKKVQIGSKCPICDFADPPREHVSRHFMPELLEHLNTLDNQLECTECNYRGEKPQNLAKHIALVHSMLDQLLREEDLVAAKRQEFLAKPKKVSIGENCPICDCPIPKRDSRVHVIWHFMEDLRAMVDSFDDPKSCGLCGYRNPRPDKMAKHLALGHSKLDELLMNEELVLFKREVALNKPKKLVLGPKCPICDMQFTKNQNRDHVAWHFMDELREIVQAFEDPRACNQCPYISDKVDNLVKHIALGHSKLDELMQDTALVAEKRALALSKPKKLSLGPTCPICDMTFTKNQNRDHVAWHFMEELREHVMTFEDPKSCNLCQYTSEKLDNLVKHIALGHSRLDELLQDEELVERKRSQVQAKPGKKSKVKEEEDEEIKIDPEEMIEVNPEEIEVNPMLFEMSMEMTEEDHEIKTEDHEIMTEDE